MRYASSLKQVDCCFISDISCGNNMGQLSLSIIFTFMLPLSSSWPFSLTDCIAKTFLFHFYSYSFTSDLRSYSTKQRLREWIGWWQDIYMYIRCSELKYKSSTFTSCGVKSMSDNLFYLVSLHYYIKLELYLILKRAKKKRVEFRQRSVTSASAGENLTSASSMKVVSN